MVKKTIKIYLEEVDEKAFKQKAETTGFTGRGAISHFIEKICKEPILFLDENTKLMLRTLDLK